MFAAIDKLRARFKPAQWASYFTFHAVQALAHAMPRQLGEAAFELQKLVSGVEKQRERSRRCIAHTTAALGELLGQSYVASYFPGSSKQTATRLVDALVAAMVDDISRLDWMADATKQIALAKLARLVRMIGYPERWKTYDFDVKRDDFAGNVLRATAFEVRRELAKAGKPVDRSEWQMNAYHVDAYYNPSANNTALPAGILQPPFWGKDRSVPANLGGIGMVVGHELTHGFDDQGAQFDPDGNMKMWWQQDDFGKFQDKGKCMADEYSKFEVLPGKFDNGQLTLGENIADNGGIKVAFRAYRKLRENATEHVVADGLTEDQQFFVGVGQAWCSKDRDEEALRRLTTDVHSPPKWRVIGALSNNADFQKAFNCPEGSRMHPKKMCPVW